MTGRNGSQPDGRRRGKLVGAMFCILGIVELDQGSEREGSDSSLAIDQVAAEDD